MTKFGKRLTMVSITLMALCVAPIMLYALFGPADGNPVGLGLLMVFGAPVFGAASLVGAIVWIAGIVRDARQEAGKRNTSDE